MKKKLNILGIRGLPAAHGGFETFAHHFALYMVSQGWEVVVYCQQDSKDPLSVPDFYEDTWEGVKRVHISVDGNGSFATIKFDWKAAVHASRSEGVDLILGYNTALFGIIHRLRGKKIAINMDGVEWRRDKWGWLPKAWFYLNEFAGCHISNTVIADHPEIANHLKRHACDNSIVIPYGADAFDECDSEILKHMGLERDKYYISIARIEPENSILEIIKSFVSSDQDNVLVVLGKIDADNKYHREVVKAAHEKVIFLGAIYDKKIVQNLRVGAIAYLHGHQVGGTNPSLVEALGCGSAVIAHNNKFNKWVAGDQQAYFSSQDELKGILEKLSQNSVAVTNMRVAAKSQHSKNFTYSDVHRKYEAEMTSLLSVEHQRMLIALGPRKNHPN